MKTSGARRAAGAVRISVLLALLACAGSSARPVAVARSPARHEPSSKVTFGDYAGSAACAPCHAEEFAAWERSPMHRMTRDAPGAAVRAPFDGTAWTFKADRAVLETHADGARWMRIEGPAGPEAYRVTRIVGGRTREDFVGVREGNDEEVVLPVSYVYATGAFRAKGYSVMSHERPGLRAGPVWSRTCLFCHNTVPELDRVLGEVDPRRPYQAEPVDRWLPRDKRSRLSILDPRAFGDAVGAEVVRIGGSVDPSVDARDVARAGIDAVRSHFDGRSLVEVGIGCEACHDGSRAHASDPGRVPALGASAPWLRDAPSSPARAVQINRVCARCHQVLFSRYPFTWEGGSRDGIAGGSHINSGEGRDFLLGACSGALSCTDCHDPHGGGAHGGASLEAMATPAENGVCTRCHQDLADAARLRAHAHHDPAGRAGSCVACHMPRKNMGLGGVLTRYHRIGSPTDPARVLGDRPLECALCHTDKTVGALVDAMQSWWPVRYPVQRLIELYGSLDANVMRATLERGKPHEQAVAIASLGEARAADATAPIAAQLLNPYPLVREWALRALVALRGSCDVNLAADDATIATQARRCGAGTLEVPATSGPDEPPED